MVTLRALNSHTDLPIYARELQHMFDSPSFEDAQKRHQSRGLSIDLRPRLIETKVLPPPRILQLGHKPCRRCSAVGVSAALLKARPPMTLPTILNLSILFRCNEVRLHPFCRWACGTMDMIVLQPHRTLSCNTLLKFCRSEDQEMRDSGSTLN